MEPRGLLAKAAIEIEAPFEQVWDALTTPATIKQYMFGTEVRSRWEKGSPITWSGEWEGKAYQDKGEILLFEPPTLIQCSHYSPLSGLPDVPENYHTVTVELTQVGDNTQVTLTQDNNATEEERDHSAANWHGMLDSLKKLLET